MMLELTGRSQSVNVSIFLQILVVVGLLAERAAAQGNTGTAFTNIDYGDFVYPYQ